MPSLGGDRTSLATRGLDNTRRGPTNHEAWKTGGENLESVHKELTTTDSNVDEGAWVRDG